MNLDHENYYEVKAMLILASSSIGRRKVLEKLGLKFEVMPADIDEGKIKAFTPLALVKKIAKAKAMAVLGALGGKKLLTHSRVAGSVVPERGTKRSISCLAGRQVCTVASGTTDLSDSPILIIAADSLVYFAGKTFGKPKTKEEAARFLRMLSGETHEFLTGICVINTKTNAIYQKSCKTKVIFDRFTEEEIDEYVKKADVTSHAGAYSTEDKFIKTRCKLIGSETNVIGLPLEKLLPILASQGVALRS